MVLWLKKPDGSSVRITDPWKPKIHIGGSYRDLLDLACRPGLEDATFVEMYEKAGDRERSRVLEVEVDGDREAVSLARKLEQFGRYSKFRFYDIDVPSPQMYLYRKGLFPLAFVEAKETARGISWTLKDSRESIDYQLPPLREIAFQINTEKTRKIRGFEDKLASVHFARGNEILVIDAGNEVDKILGLVEAFRVEDPDVVVTHGGDSFIFPYLARRAQEHGILDQLILGRDISPLRVYEVQGHSYFSYGKILYRETAARLLGRLHVDQNNAYVSADCGLEGLFEVSRTCIMPIQKASRATIGTNMTSLQLYHAVKRDVLIPWNKNQPEELKNSGELVTADRGGFIYEPQIGIHDHVGELDFACIAKNAAVETRKGRKYVVDVTECDEVFPPFGWQRVSTVHKYRIKSKVFRLTLEDGKTLTCTARHKFPVLIKDSFKERRSNDIRRGSRLIVADILQVFQENELACIFGAFTAEGSSIRSDYQYFDKVRNKKRISHQYKIEFDIGEQETDFRDFIVNTLSRIYPEIHFYERRKKGERCLSISISQKAIVNDFLSKYNSFIANNYLTLDEKASFLRGFFEGDGSINTRRNTIQCNQSFVNTEKLEIVCKYLRELNIKNRVGTYKYAYSTNPTLFLELSGLEAHVRYYTQVGFISKNKEEKLRQIMLTRIRKAQHFNNPRFGVYIKARKNNALSFLRESRVINKEILDYDDYVYDITLEWEEFPYYFANGILTHNSLYPTLMTRMNLSGETVNCTCCPDSANRVPELEFNICERSAGIVPLSLKILLDKRARYKAAKKTVVDEELKTLYDRRQSALKWILVCSFGYLGFKNARFGKIDAHIATCAFSRKILREAAALAEARGFTLVHGIVDSFWLRKKEATRGEYEDLCREIRDKLRLPVSFEGQYKWIVFLNSKTDPQAPVLNRYYGIFQDRTLKVRGIDVRRHDTPKIVEKCQTQMLGILKEADNSREFQALIPQVLNTLREYASKLRSGTVPIEELVITKNLSKMPNEYAHRVPQAIAAQCLINEGGTVHAGQQVSYVLTIDTSAIPESQAIPPELADGETVYDPERYVDLLVSATANLLLPFGYDVKSLIASLGRPVRAAHSRRDSTAHQQQIRLQN